MKKRTSRYYIINALLGGLFLYQAVNTYYTYKSTFGAILFGIFGLLELYFAYGFYKGKWDDIKF